MCLPLALALGENYPLIGYDKNLRRIEELSAGMDRTAEVSGEVLTQTKVRFTMTFKSCAIRTFHHCCADAGGSKQPARFDGTKGRSESVAGVMREGSIVVVESTVYPGVTEYVCGTMIEKISGLHGGQDFFSGIRLSESIPGIRSYR